MAVTRLSSHLFTESPLFAPEGRLTDVQSPLTGLEKSKDETRARLSSYFKTSPHSPFPGRAARLRYSQMNLFGKAIRIAP